MDHIDLDDMHLDEIVEQHVRMVCISIHKKNKAMAHAAVDRAFFAMEESMAVPRWQVIESILNLRMATILRAGGIETIGDLCEHTRDTLAEIHGIRYRSVSIIEAQLAKHGHRLKRTCGSDQD